MALDSDIARDILNEVATDLKLGRSVKEIETREESGEYLVLFDDNAFTTIREKVIDQYSADKSGDVKRDIGLRIRTAEILDEADLPQAGGEEEEDEIVIDEEVD